MKYEHTCSKDGHLCHDTFLSTSKSSLFFFSFFLFLFFALMSASKLVVNKIFVLNAGNDLSSVSLNHIFKSVTCV